MGGVVPGSGVSALLGTGAPFRRRSAPATLLACLAAAVLSVVVGGGEARAQTSSAPGDEARTCGPVEKELASSQKEAAQCEQSRAHLCSATAAFADELTRGHAKGASETGCVSLEQQRRLDELVTGWSATVTSLGQIAAYEAGETNTLPVARGGATPAERALLRVLGSGHGRAFYRRLLVEALELVAPQSWAAIRAEGGTALDAWFADRSPLASDLVEEARRAHGSRDVAGPSLTAALHLVNAFEVAAKCGVPAEPGECTRAQQLKQLLESSGALVVRRRIEEIWATECTTMTPDAVVAWVSDFPSAHLDDATNAWNEIAHNAFAKLFACYLDDASEHAAFGRWLKEQLPSATSLNAERLRRVDLIQQQWRDGSSLATCARAARAMQTLAVPSSCSVPGGDFRPALKAWGSTSTHLDTAEFPLAMCSQFTLLLWQGNAASLAGSFARPPSLDEVVVAAPGAATPMSRLRAHCAERRGAIGSFEADVAELGTISRAFGEGVDGLPFRLDPQTMRPVELVRFEAVQGLGPWASHVARGATACGALGMTNERCGECSKISPDGAFDCALVARLDRSWTERTRALLAALGAVLATILGATWARRLVRARRSFAAWARDTATFFDGIGLACRLDRWRLVMPSRHDAVLLTLPSEAAWERWGSVAAVVRAPKGPRVRERDVNHAAFVARRAAASVVLLEHDDEAGPDLSAVRAMLEWAAKGGERAVQILPIGVARARWSKSAHDVLDLVEESSLRGNPFEWRGRIASSTQFFNRERLVSGLLAAAQAGHWMVVTGLRRFGKSSLALEVVRRLPGPAAYVDLAGFDHEIAHGSDPAVAAGSILRFVCLRLHESATARWPGTEMPDPPTDDSSVDLAVLTKWLRSLSRQARIASGHSVPFLVILDEIEQALAVGPDKLAHALDVLAIVVGRLKSAVGDAAVEDGAPISAFLTSAIHPLLWAPLRPLAQQSIIGSFERVCVPCLAAEAATTMMRSLGARQGVRFNDDALARLVKEAQGVPLLLRRLGASILELYDAERARQGSLGAVEIGVEGASEAISREAREGSPLRVWIETEIAARGTVPGELLRRLAREETVPVGALHALAKRRIGDEFVRTGIAAALPQDEVARRAEEAAHVIVQLLGESGLIVPHGDLTAPDGYSLPDGVIRRVLRAQATAEALPASRGE